MRRGFTLVELAIVLVIIGLLIGSILAAQSMISTARITAQIRQFGQNDAAVALFKSQYGFLPGDAPVYGGNGDGVVDRNGNQVNCFDGELSNYWYNLYNEQFSAPGNNIILSGSGQNILPAKMGAAQSFIIVSGYPNLIRGPAIVDTANPLNYYSMYAGSYQVDPNNHCFSTSTGVGNSAVKPAELLALDKKMDDGLADSGDVVSGVQYGGIYIDPPASCSVDSTYIVNTNSYDCTPLIRLGGQTGTPQ